MSLHKAISSDLHAKGEHYILHCKNCGGKLECSEEDFSRYLAHGWPQCCGVTMSLERVDR